MGIRRTVGLLVVGFLLSTALAASAMQTVGATSEIDTSQAYSSGLISGTQGAWYTWINESGVKLVFLALYSPVFNSPVFAFVGQEYNTLNKTPVFVGNALMLMEVFNDTNHNGVLDANYTAGTSEVKYTVLVNSSQSFVPTPVSENVTKGAVHFYWGIDYKGIDAFLIAAGQDGSGYGGGTVASKVNLDHLGISYEYTIANNTTYLQSKYNIGNFALASSQGGSGNSSVTLDGLSLSLLFSTVTISSKDYTVATSSSSPSSAGAGNSSLSNAKVRVGNMTAFEYLFNDNYTLAQPSPTQYRADIASARPDSVPSSLVSSPWLSPVWRIQSYLQSLPIYDGLPSTPDLNYTQSRFLYRLQFEHWSGNALVEDPTFIAYLSSSGGVVSNPASALAPYLIVAAAASGVILAAIAAADLFRRRKLKEGELPLPGGAGAIDLTII